MKDYGISAKIHMEVQRLLSNGNLPDAELVYQEACTKLLGWIQEHIKEAQKYFPNFWKEEDQMRLLTPKAAVKIQKKAKALEEVLNVLGAENLEAAKEKIAKWKEDKKLL